MCKWVHNKFFEIPNNQRWIHSSFLEISSHESADSSGAQARGTRDKASKPASNLSEPTCKAATRVEVSPAKPKPTTSPKLKPATSIEQSSNRAIESNLQIEPKLQRFLMGPPDARHRPANMFASPFFCFSYQNIIKMTMFHWKTAQMASRQPPGN